MTSPPSPSAESLEFRILRALRRIIRRTTEHSRDLHRESGLSVPELLCLKAVEDHRQEAGLTGVKIAELVQLSTATVSRILERLEAAQYITRIRDQADRRRFLFTVTREGQSRLKKSSVPLQEQFLNRLLVLSDEERSRLVHSLEQIVTLMDAQGVDASPMLTGEYDLPRSHGE